MRFVKDTLLTFSARIAGVILGMAGGIVIARVLGPGGRGTYTLVTMVPTMLVMFGDLGIGASTVYFGGGKKYQWTQLVSNSLVSALIIGILLTGVFLAYYLLAHPPFLKDAAPNLLVIASVTVSFGLMAAYLSSVLLGQRRMKWYNLSSLLGKVVFVLSAILALLVFREGILGVIIAWAVAEVAALAITLVVVSRTVPLRLGFHPGVFVDSAKFGLQVYLTNVVQFLNYRLDTFLVAYFLNTAFVGYYSVAVNWAEALWYLPAAVGTVVVSRTPGMRAGELNRSTPQVCRNTVLVTLLCALVLGVVARPMIVLLYGGAFAPSVAALLWLLPGVVALSLWKVLGNEIAMRGLPILNAVAAVVSLVINLSLNIILIPRIGISGASIASSASYTVTAVIVLGFYLKMSKNTLSDTIVIKPADLRMYLDVLKKGMTYFRRNQPLPS